MRNAQIAHSICRASLHPALVECLHADGGPIATDVQYTSCIVSFSHSLLLPIDMHAAYALDPNQMHLRIPGKHIFQISYVSLIHVEQRDKF